MPLDVLTLARQSRAPGVYQTGWYAVPVGAMEFRIIFDITEATIDNPLANADITIFRSTDAGTTKKKWYSINFDGEPGRSVLLQGQPLFQKRELITDFKVVNSVPVGIQGQSLQLVLSVGAGAAFDVGVRAEIAVGNVANITDIRQKMMDAESAKATIQSLITAARV